MQKIDAEIARMVSDILNKNLSEEVSFAVINSVITSKDLSQAKVYIYFAAENPEKEFVKLKKNAGLVQHEFAKIIHLRKTPHLHFILDTKQPQIDKVEEIIEKINIKP